MKLPFTIQKKYTSNFSADNILEFIKNLDEQKSNYLGFDFKDYEVKSSNSNFDFQRRKKKSETTMHPTVNGTISPDKSIEIKVQPNMTGFIIFALIAFVTVNFIYTGIGNLIKTGSFTSLILPVLLSAFAFFYYKRVTNPIASTVEWLEESLELSEL